MTVAQFSILNAVWAATIVLAEVPSGALADVVGRKRLLVFATLVMIIEIGIISFMPKTNPSIVFMVFLINRILSGLAEAAASGADEALAYDSLVAHDICDQWGRVLEILARFQSIGFVVAMSVGAAIYDPVLLTKICSFLGSSKVFTQEITMRFPLYLTLILAIGAFIATMKIQEIMPASTERQNESGQLQESDQNREVRQAFLLTFKAGKWILQTPFVLSVFLFGMLFDGIIRMVITLSSQYYRMIELPESSFGIVGSVVAMLGLIIPKIARSIAEKHSPSHGLSVAAALTITGLISMSFFWPYAGIIPALITFSAMYFTGFFVSFYMNEATASDQRATVLSFKGLAYNLSYGILGILYALLLKAKKDGVIISQELENKIFMDTFIWFPGVFIFLFVVLTLICWIWFREDAKK